MLCQSQAGSRFAGSVLLEGKKWHPSYAGRATIVRCSYRHFHRLLLPFECGGTIVVNRDGL